MKLKEISIAAINWLLARYLSEEEISSDTNG